MMRIYSYLLGTSVFFAATAPAFAGTTIPAPIVGAGLSGLVALGLAGGGYLFLKWRRRRD